VTAFMRRLVSLREGRRRRDDRKPGSSGLEIRPLREGIGSIEAEKGSGQASPGKELGSSDRSTSHRMTNGAPFSVAAKRMARVAQNAPTAGLLLSFLLHRPTKSSLHSSCYRRLRVNASEHTLSHAIVRPMIRS
jgi:hypothetical protein